MEINGNSLSFHTLRMKRTTFRAAKAGGKSGSVKSARRQKVVVSARGTSEFDDPLTLWDQYVKLNQEIADLQCDVKPLRQRYLQLQSAIVANHRSLPARNPAEITLDSEEVNSSVPIVDFPTAIIQFQTESDSLKSQVNRTRQLFSPVAIKILETEVEEGQRHVEVLSANIRHTEKEIEKLRTDIDGYRLSRMYEDVQIQKQRIHKLQDDLDMEVQLHSQLKNEHYMLAEAPEDAALADEAAILSRLTRKLSETRRRHFEQCELLIAVRNKQMREIETVGSALTSARSQESRG